MTGLSKHGSGPLRGWLMADHMWLVSLPMAGDTLIGLALYYVLPPGSMRLFIFDAAHCGGLTYL